MVEPGCHVPCSTTKSSARPPEVQTVQTTAQSSNDKVQATNFNNNNNNDNENTVQKGTVVKVTVPGPESSDRTNSVPIPAEGPEKPRQVGCVNM